MEYSNGNSNFELLDQFPGDNSRSNYNHIDRETTRIKQVNDGVAHRNRYNPQLMRIPETNYTTHYNNIEDVSPNYKTDNQPHITNFEMNYPGYLEGKPVRTISAVKYEAKDTNDYMNNLNYPNTDNLYYNNYKNPSKSHSCLENYEHFTNCPLCSNIAKTHVKLYWVIIAVLVIIIIFMATQKKK
jgi:hypothetical protein